MTEDWVLIDTSAWIHALRPEGRADFKKCVFDTLALGRAATTEMVILELAGGTRSEKDYVELREDLEALQQLSVTESIWQFAYDMGGLLRRKGVSVPATDQLIASVAIKYRCTLLHSDKHFEFIANHVALSLWRP
jgi:hypothetical protein